MGLIYSWLCCWYKHIYQERFTILFQFSIIFLKYKTDWFSSPCPFWRIANDHLKFVKKKVLAAWENCCRLQWDKPHKIMINEDYSIVQQQEESTPDNFKYNFFHLWIQCLFLKGSMEYAIFYKVAVTFFALNFCAAVPLPAPKFCFAIPSYRKLILGY